MKILSILLLSMFIFTGCKTSEVQVLESTYTFSAEEMANLMVTNSGDHIDYTSTITITQDYYIDANASDNRNFYIMCGDYTNRYILVNGLFVEVDTTEPIKKIKFDPYKKAK